ncbi:hypothetical protein [Oricola indica]|uniref:hypothetical protein n=1 Tax=Oricola indica TaxID=2872591 RepID=UPI003CCC2644
MTSDTNRARNCELTAIIRPANPGVALHKNPSCPDFDLERKSGLKKAKQIDLKTT